MAVKSKLLSIADLAAMAVAEAAGEGMDIDIEAGPDTGEDDGAEETEREDQRMPATRKRKSSKRDSDTFPEATDLIAAKLATSGLNASAARKLGIEEADYEEMRELGLHRKVPAMVIPYFNMDHEPIDFARYRYLKDSRTPMERTAKLKERRYVQPPKTLAKIYFPPILPWSTIAKDTTQTIAVTEGELKAACVSKFVMPCLGLGGVYSFRARKQGVNFVPELMDIEWNSRKVVIVFDSDAESNHMVVSARNALAEELTNRGAIVFIATIPTPKKGGKLGIDDYFMEFGEKSTKLLLTEKIEPWQFGAELFKLNAEVAYITALNKVVRIDTGDLMSPHEFINYAYAPRRIQVKVDDKIRTIPAAEQWMRWDRRREAAKLVYEPGQDLFTHEGNFNSWRGWGVKPEKGDITPWVKLLDHLFTGKPAERRWFEQWCAIPLQQPGAKQFTTAVLWSLQTGNGKSLIGRSLGRIYGDNYTLIGDHELEDRRYEWAENKQFVMGDDVTGKDQRKYADRLKMIITQPMMRLNIKYVKSYSVTDHINYLFTSNHPDAFFLEDRDRRYFIHNANVDPLKDSFYADYVEWLEGDGAAHLFYHLLHLEIGNRTAADRAPDTQDKDEMIALGKSDLATWVNDLKHRPDNVLRVGDAVLDGDLWTLEELLSLYDPDGKTRVTLNGMARELSRAGFAHACRSSQIKLPNGTTKRLYIIRHVEKWRADLDVKAAVTHYVKSRNVKGVKF